MEGNCPFACSPGQEIIMHTYSDLIFIEHCSSSRVTRWPYDHPPFLLLHPNPHRSPTVTVTSCIFPSTLTTVDKDLPTHPIRIPYHEKFCAQERGKFAEDRCLVTLSASHGTLLSVPPRGNSRTTNVIIVNCKN
jgi:hypothetical protein